MKRYGLDWTDEGGDEWTGVSGRFTVHIWMFGPRHQCKVFVDYEHSKDTPDIGLPISDTRDEAMKRGAAWIEQYKASGPSTPDDVFGDCYTHYKDLFQYRHQVINQLLFVIGNGYDWLDGAIVSNSPYDHLESSGIEDKLARMEQEDEQREADWESLRAAYPELGEYPMTKRARKTVVPRPDDGRPLRLYPVSQNYSNVFSVPSDVKDAWLQVAYEAALMLRDRSDVNNDDPDTRTRQLTNKKAGEGIVRDLVTRFGPRIEKL